MPESAETQILWTKVADDGPDTARVELAIAHAPNLEDATETIVISVRIAPSHIVPMLAAYQLSALNRAAALIREHSHRLEASLNN